MSINGFIGRRKLLLAGGGMGLTALGSSRLMNAQAAEPKPPAQGTRAPVSPDAALQRLMDGNERFSQEKRSFPDQSRLRLQEVAIAQFPFAAMLGCADSRVPVEIVFDQGLGDIFTVRVAGNVVTPHAIGSIEYAVAELGAQLIVILGHENCGAVKAAIKGEPLPGRIGTFVEDIRPAVERVRNNPGDIVNNSVIANVQLQVEELKQNSVLLTQLVGQKKLKIVGARYDLDTGLVTIVA